MSIQAQAALSDLPVSPQATAMGGAALAEDGDSSALFLNPGALGSVTQPDLYFMYDRVDGGLDGTGEIGQGLMSAAAPTRIGTFSAGLGMLNAQGLETEREIELGYARKEGPFSFGLAGKELYQGYQVGGDPLAAGDPVFSHGTSRSALSVDAGMVYDASPSLKLGLAVRNFNQPNLGLASVDVASRQIQASAAYVWPKSGWKATADLVYTQDPELTWQSRVMPSLGFEKNLYDGRAAFRVGVTTLGLSAGFGLRLGAIGVDYSIVMAKSLVGSGFGTQMLGLRYRFGGSSSAPAPILSAVPVAPVPVRARVIEGTNIPYEPL